MWGGRARLVALVVGVLLVAIAMGVVSVTSQDYAVLVACVVLAAGLIFVDPVLIVVLAPVATLLMSRVGGALSVSDVVLAAGMLVALVMFRARGLRDMAPLLWAGTFYLATAVPTLILNRYSANVVEWLHEVVLVLGSMVVGYTIGQRGRARQAVGIYVVACVGIAIAAAIVGLYMLATGQGFGPVYLPMLDKNLIGGVLAATIVIVYGRPAWFPISRRLGWFVIAVSALGLMASGARQAIIGAVAGLVVLSLRPRPDTGRRPKLVWIVGIPAVIFVLTLVNDQLTSDNAFNSANQRLNWYADTIGVWLTSPVFGVGLRWWYTSRFNVAFQPPNAEFEVISSVGVVGLIGFLVMFIVGMVALWRINPAYGMVGVAIIGTRFAAGQFDLYWVAGQSSFLWIIAGICYGALAYDRAQGREQFATRPAARRGAVRAAAFHSRTVGYGGSASSASHI